MASKAVYINEAGIRRRWNPRDVHHHSSGGNDLRGPAPNVHNSLAIQKKHVASMYRSWRSLNSHPHGPLDTDLYARHIPVGRVCAQRTSRAPLTETDLGNMYAGSYVFAPGPCAYDANKDSWCAQPGPKLGHAPRKCMTAGENHPQLAHAKRLVGESPGPGAYAMGDSSVMANRGGTFAAADERNGAASALEMAVGRLRTLEWRIGFIRRGLREPEGLRLGQALVVKTQSGRELERIESIASRLRVEVERLAERAAAVAAKRDPLPGPSLGGSSGLGRVPGGDRRPASTAEGGCASRKRLARGQGADRFYDPLASTASFLDSPGPGTYDLRRDENALGRASLWRSPSFDLIQRRVVGEQATTGRSLVSLKLHRTCGRGGGSGGGGGGGGVGGVGGVDGVVGGGGDGSGGDDGGGGGGGGGGNVDEKTHIMAPFHAYVSEAGPGQYTPDMCAPPLTSQARRRRVAANP